jgi:hypothetical protein
MNLEAMLPQQLRYRSCVPDRIFQLLQVGIIANPENQGDTVSGGLAGAVSDTGA